MARCLTKEWSHWSAGPSTAHNGMIRFMKPSNSGTVKAVSPWAGLKTIPFEINERVLVLEIQPNLDVLILHLQCTRKAGKGLQRILYACLGCLASAESK